MWVNEFNAMINFTKNFLEPFHQMSELELTQDGDSNPVSPWVATSELLFLFWGYFLSQHSKAKLWRHDKSPNVKIPGEKSPTEEKSPTSPPYFRPNLTTTSRRGRDFFMVRRTKLGQASLFHYSTLPAVW